MLPLIGKRARVNYDLETGQVSDNPVCDPFRHEGSFSTSLKITIRRNRIYVSGNPSRFNRLDNLQGLPTLDDCFRVYNDVLKELSSDLPPFTRCTKVWFTQGEDGSKVNRVTDGAVIHEVHVTENRCVGQGNSRDYLRGLSTLNYRDMHPDLKPNGCTVQWLNRMGAASTHIYPSCYDKANEIRVHNLPKVKRKFGADSPEYSYLLNLCTYLESFGCVRFEQKFHSAFLRKNNVNHYGLFDDSFFKTYHDEFLALDKKLQVEKVDIETIAQQLVRQNICTNTKAALTTAWYAYEWMHNNDFDFNKSQVKIHAARLNCIGINIRKPYDSTRHSLINVRDSRLVEIKHLVLPDWYQHPKRNVSYLKLVA